MEGFNIEDIYTQIIIENSNSKKHMYKMDDPNKTQKGINPSCGDEIEIEIKVEDGIINDISFIGSGCAISRASTSIMIDTIKGKDINQAKNIIHSFLNLIKKQELTDEEKLKLGDALALENISNMPARVKCATLAWHTLEEMLK